MTLGPVAQKKKKKEKALSHIHVVIYNLICKESIMNCAHLAHPDDYNLLFFLFLFFLHQVNHHCTGCCRAKVQHRGPFHTKMYPNRGAFLYEKC